MRKMLAILGLLALGFLAGCGRQGTAPSGTEVVVRLVDPFGNAGLGRVAYRVGDGPWRSLNARGDGIYRFRLPPGARRYSVAASCPQFGPIQPSMLLGRVLVYELSTEDTAAPVLPCGNGNGLAIGALSVTVDAGAVGANKILVLGRSPAFELRGGSGTVGAPVGTRRFLVLAYHGDAEPANLKAVRAFTASVPGSAALVLGNEDAVDLAAGTRTGEVVAFPYPSGYQPHFGVGYYARRGVVAVADPFAFGAGLPLFRNPLGNGDTAGGRYALVHGAEADELLVFEALAVSSDGTRVVGTLAFRPADTDRFDPGTPPDPWPSGYAPAPSARPRFSLDRGDAPAGFRVVFPDPGSLESGILEAYVSAAWLGDRRAYEPPDLSGLPGFEGARPLSGEEVSWRVDALFSATPLGTWLASPDWLVWNIPLFDASLGTQPVVAGGTLRFATARGRFTVP